MTLNCISWDLVLALSIPFKVLFAELSVFLVKDVYGQPVLMTCSKNAKNCDAPTATQCVIVKKQYLIVRKKKKRENFVLFFKNITKRISQL